MQKVEIENKYFLEIFPEISVNEKYKTLLSNVKIYKINVFRKSRTLEICIISKELISSKVLLDVEEELKKVFQLDSVKINPKFETTLSLKEILGKYWQSIILIVNSKVALTKGILKDSSWNIVENKIIINLKNTGAQILNYQKCNSVIENIIKDYFSFNTKIEFKDFEINEKIIDEYIELKESNEAQLINDTVVIVNESKIDKGKNNDIPKCTDKCDRGAVIIGKIFNDTQIPMNEITQDSGQVSLCGDVFRVEFRELRSGKFICNFDVTDYTSSITCKFFVDKNDVDFMKERVKPNISVKVRGEAQYDKFSRELGVFAKDIIEANREFKMDTAEEKRVELHLHTQMSSMDGVTNVKDLVARAAKWGHSAVAITDHGVVQAFPDAHIAAKKSGIKVIYGMECYLLDDNVPIVYNKSKFSLDDEFVVLDIETTGLNKEKDKITEIGAVKIRNGIIIDKFSSFVNPEVPIPSFITKLTGITDDMVKDAPTIEAVLLEFLEFINGTTLVAHNAAFDLGFIKYNAKIMGEKIHNPVIDTLQLCRKLFPNLNRYKLNIVAKHLGIILENHHRAVDDSLATAEIFIKCIEILKGKGAETIDDIENILDGEIEYKKSKSYHAIILVQNYIGLKNLYKIVSESHLKYFHKRPRVPKKLLMKYREGLILGSACEAGELYRAILEKKDDNELSKIIRFYDYLEIQPLGNNEFLVNSGKVTGEEELKKINRKIVRLGNRFGKPVVATCDVHFMDSRDEVFRRVLMAGRGFADADNQAPLYFRTTKEMLDEFAYLGNETAFEVVVTNTNKIADSIEKIIPIPDGTFPPKIEGAEEEIKALAEGKAKEIYGEELPEVVRNQLDKELNSIIKNGFSVMYIIAQKLVWKSLEDGYLVGSRGSVGSSFVANMIGITEVNSLPAHYICEKCKYSEFITDGSVACGFDLPEKNCPNCDNPLKRDGYDIPFETFLGFDGDKEPDIDLNFSGEYQPKAHKYTEELFGEGHVFRAGTIATVAEKTAFGYVKGYLDEREKVVTNAEITRMVNGCTGIKRTTGQHPGGVMVVPHNMEIYDFCPIQRPADDVNSDITTTHFDYHSISGRILKLDILGHDDPTVIRMLEDLTGVNAQTIPIGEKKTMGLFKSTEALGIKPEDINSEVGTFAIPEFGTKFVRQMLVDTKPTTFAELIRISGLSHGTDVWLNNAQDLVRDRVATLPEVICTRDDIMIFLMHAGLEPLTSFKIMEDVRKGKGLKEEYEKAMRENNVPEWYIQSCKKIKYMFPKAHAAAYVMMAFRIAWFKVYYPEAFYVTYFTVRADEFDADIVTHGQDKIRNKIKELEKKGNEITQKEKNLLTILEVANEMYARGIKCLPVDLYKSDSIKFQITSEGIRPPLNALQGLGTAAAQNIVEARKNGQFLSIEDVRIKCKISKAVIEILQNHGCLKGMADSNQMSFF